MKKFLSLFSSLLKVNIDFAQWATSGTNIIDTNSSQVQIGTPTANGSLLSDRFVESRGLFMHIKF